jgi:hypothetical protein
MLITFPRITTYPTRGLRWGARRLQGVQSPHVPRQTGADQSSVARDTDLHGYGSDRCGAQQSRRWSSAYWW